MKNNNIKPIFTIGDVVKHKDSGVEHLITGVDIEQHIYLSDDFQNMIAWCFPFYSQNDYVKVGHKSMRKSGAI